MKDKLNEQVSALLDNELSDIETSSVLAKISHDHELRQKWERYNMISDVIRGEAVNIQAGDISQRVKDQIDAEPAIISIPKKSRTKSWKSNWTKPAAGAALAASVATAVVLNAPGLLGLNEPEQPITAANIKNTTPAPAVQVVHQTAPGTRWKNLTEPSLQSRLNGYLVNHSEYATPGTGIRVMPYATFVGYDSKPTKPKR